MRAAAVALAAVIAAAAAALAGCSVDPVDYTPGGGAEVCEVAGDEDGNGVADCADPACAGAAACQARCGNSRRDPGEACDDGNQTDGDGCDHDCTATACGNGIKTAGESCDDGNQAPGDGCEVTCKTTGSGNYEAVADATVRQSSAPADATTNFGAQPGLFTYGSSFGTTARSLLIFDLAALPAGTVIRRARLQVRLVDQAGADYAIEVHEIRSPWLENGVTWNTQPVFTPAAEASLAFQGLAWWRFDVTALVQRWVDTPSSNRGVVLVQSPETFPSGGEFARFDSREGANRPFLEIDVGN
jgi:cysteine-rich repeat protein